MKLVIIGFLFTVACSSVKSQSWLSHFCQYAGHGTIEVYQLPQYRMEHFGLHGSVKKVFEIDSSYASQNESANDTLPSAPDVPPNIRILIFDSLGNLKERLDSSSFPSQSEHIFYEYDKHGNLISSKSRDNYGREFYLQWTYDNQNLWQGASFYSPDTEGGVRTHLGVIWNAEGINRLIDSTKTGLNNWTFTKFSLNNDTVKLKAHYVDYPFGVPHSQSVTAIFDKNGSLLSILDSNNGTEEFSYYFDRKGNLISKKTVDFGDLVFRYFETISYNSNGEETEHQELTDSIVKPDSSNIRSWIRYKHRYDVRGNWVERIGSRVHSESANICLRRVEYW